jgi:hypothetical protein
MESQEGKKTKDIKPDDSKNKGGFPPESMPKPEPKKEEDKD